LQNFANTTANSTANPTANLTANLSILLTDKSPEHNSLLTPANKVLQLKANSADSLELNLHKGMLYKLLGGQKRISCTGFTQKDRHNLAIPKPFHRDCIKLQTGYLATEYKQQLLAY